MVVREISLDLLPYTAKILGTIPLSHNRTLTQTSLNKQKIVSLQIVIMIQILSSCQCKINSFKP